MNNPKEKNWQRILLAGNSQEKYINIHGQQLYEKMLIFSSIRLAKVEIV